MENEEVYKNNELYLNIRALGFAGFLLQENKHRSPSKILYLWFITSFIAYSVMIILGIIQYSIIMSFKLLRVLLSIYLANNLLQFWFKHLYFYLKRQGIQELFDLIEQIPANSPQFHIHSMGMQLQATKNIRRFTAIIFSYNTAFFLLGVVVPFITRTIMYANCLCFTPSPIFQIVWFKPVFELPDFYFLILWQIVTVGIFMSSSCTSDAFVCAFMLAAAERGGLLARTALQALVPTTTNKVSPYAAAWIQAHQHYLNLLAKINEVIGPLIFVVNVFAAFNIISALYFGMRADTGEQRVVAMGILLGFVTQIYVYSVAGQKIINRIQELSHAMVRVLAAVDMPFESGPGMSTLQIIAARCSTTYRLDEIKGKGFFPMSLEYFATVISASATYIIVLLQLQ